MSQCDQSYVYPGNFYHGHCTCLYSHFRLFLTALLIYIRLPCQSGGEEVGINWGLDAILPGVLCGSRRPRAGGQILIRGGASSPVFLQGCCSLDGRITVGRGVEVFLYVFPVLGTSRHHHVSGQDWFWGHSPVPEGVSPRVGRGEVFLAQ